jgi:hypothetical protein
VAGGALTWGVLSLYYGKSRRIKDVVMVDLRSIPKQVLQSALTMIRKETDLSRGLRDCVADCSVSYDAGSREFELCQELCRCIWNNDRFGDIIRCIGDAFDRYRRAAQVA